MKQNTLYDTGIVCKEYEFAFKQFFLTKKFIVSATLYEKDLNFSSRDMDSIKNDFLVYGISIKNIRSQRLVRLRAFKFIEECNLFISEIMTEDEGNLKILEISYIGVARKFRGKGIGTQLLKIIEKEAHEKQCAYIVGELQADRVGEPLDKRKTFFTKNGFEIWFDKRAKFSKWVIKKKLNTSSYENLNN